MPLSRRDIILIERVASKIGQMMEIECSRDGIYSRFARIRVNVDIFIRLKYRTMVLDELGSRV